MKLVNYEHSSRALNKNKLSTKLSHLMDNEGFDDFVQITVDIHGPYPIDIHLLRPSKSPPTPRIFQTVSVIFCYLSQQTPSRWSSDPSTTIIKV